MSSTSRRIIFTVTNDLNYDQRMQRICTTLADAGYDICLVGRELPGSKPLLPQPFKQIRLVCYRRKGLAFYAEFNIRLLFFLLKTNFDAIGTVDLDTLPAGCTASLLKRKKRVFDAHEYFTEVPEVTQRKFVKKVWSLLEVIFLPFYKYAYTVGPGLAQIFTQKTGVPFEVIRNVPVPLIASEQYSAPDNKKIMLYQGALNEGRGIENLLDAMPLLPDNFELWLAGEGDLSAVLRQRAQRAGISQRVQFLGYVSPNDLKILTFKAWLGLNLLENKGLSYYYSLANKFFDYVQAGVPVMTMNFPEYAALNQEYAVAILLDSLDAELIAQNILLLERDNDLYAQLQKACNTAAQVWNWDHEQEKLIRLWANVF